MEATWIRGMWHYLLMFIEIGFPQIFMLEDATEDLNRPPIIGRAPNRKDTLCHRLRPGHQGPRERASALRGHPGHLRDTSLLSVGTPGLSRDTLCSPGTPSALRDVSLLSGIPPALRGYLLLSG